MTSQRKVDQMFKAFADETRLRILHLLTRGELCVCDLLEILHLPQSKVSRHLAYLRKSKLVAVRKQGLWKYYSLTPSDGKFHRGLIQCLSECFKEVDILRLDMVVLQKRRKRKRC